jgi:hypothetical protein
VPNRNKITLPTPQRPEIALRPYAGCLGKEPAGKRELIEMQNSGKVNKKALHLGNVSYINAQRK